MVTMASMHCKTGCQRLYTGAAAMHFNWYERRKGRIGVVAFSATRMAMETR
jgi:hypothetical protein